MMTQSERISCRVNLKSDEFWLIINKRTLMTINLVLINLIENTVLYNEIIIFMSAMSDKSI